MTRIFFTILLGFVTSSLFGQNWNFKDYAENEWEVFSRLDSNYVLYYLKELQIKELTETKFMYDTSGNIKDSSIVRFYRFDSLGRVVEHRFDYRLCTQKYRSYVYTYSKDGTVQETYNDPYGPDAIFDGYITSGEYPIYCEYRNKSYQIETINLKISFEGEMCTMRYFYNQELSVYDRHLVSGLDFYRGDKLQYRHKIVYQK